VTVQATPAPGSTAEAPTTSSLLVGWVRHRRHRPVENAFRYRAYHALLDVDDLPTLDGAIRGFGYNRPAPIGFRDTDHLGDGALPVREKLRRWLAGEGVALPDGPLLLLANLRVLGHVFDPVSWWFCHHPDGSIAFVVAEVNNTFGDAHCYLLDDLDRRSDGSVRAEATKRLHVSPFLPVDGLSYRFGFVLTDHRVTAHVDVDDGQGRILDATQTGVRVPLTSRSLRRVAVSHPLMPLRTVALIHWQALRLAIKRVRFHRRPTPVDDGYDRITEPSHQPATPNEPERIEESTT
jgi:DUF1365 family protein